MAHETKFEIVDTYDLKSAELVDEDHTYREEQICIPLAPAWISSRF